MRKIIMAPEPLPQTIDLFLAGGISHCPDWQSDLLERLKLPLTMANPRRDFYDSAEEAEVQIAWEFEALAKSKVVSFWFPEETLCPITLYELGRISNSSLPLFVGVHPNYKRKLDLEVQLKLARPSVKIVYSLEELASQLIHYFTPGEIS